MGVSKKDVSIQVRQTGRARGRAGVRVFYFVFNISFPIKENKKLLVHFLGAWHCYSDFRSHFPAEMSRHYQASAKNFPAITS